MTRRIGTALVALIALAMTAGIGLGPSAATEVKTFKGVAYLSGGVGEDERALLASATTDFPLKIVMALRSGDYLGDVRVIITNAAGQRVLDTVSEGPWLFARLSPGTYQVRGAYSGDVLQQTVRIGNNGQTVVMLQWPEER